MSDHNGRRGGRPGTERAAAERAALAALGPHVTAVGDLAAAHAGQNAAAGGIDQARAQAAALLEEARAEGRRLQDAAAARRGQADDDYAHRYQGAIDLGWTPAQLADLGYPGPGRRRGGRARTGAEQTATGPDADRREAPPDGDVVPAGRDPIAPLPALV